MYFCYIIFIFLTFYFYIPSYLCSLIELLKAPVIVAAYRKSISNIYPTTILNLIETITDLNETSVYRAFNISSDDEAGFKVTIAKFFNSKLGGGISFQSKSLEHLSTEYLIKAVLLGAAVSNVDTKLNYMEGVGYMHQKIFMEEYNQIYSVSTVFMSLTLTKIASSYQTLSNNEFVEKYNITSSQLILLNKRTLDEIKMAGFNVKQMTFIELMNLATSKYGEFVL